MHRGTIFKLTKNLCGGTLAGYYYFTSFKFHLQEVQYIPIDADPFLVNKQYKDGDLWSANTVDEFLAIGTTEISVSDFHMHLSHKYKVKSLVRPTLYLSWHISTTRMARSHLSINNHRNQLCRHPEGPIIIRVSSLIYIYIYK